MRIYTVYTRKTALGIISGVASWLVIMITVSIVAIEYAAHPGSVVLFLLPFITRVAYLSSIYAARGTAHVTLDESGITINWLKQGQDTPRNTITLPYTGIRRCKHLTGTPGKRVLEIIGRNGKRYCLRQHLPHKQLAPDFFPLLDAFYQGMNNAYGHETPSTRQIPARYGPPRADQSISVNLSMPANRDSRSWWLLDLVLVLLLVNCILLNGFVAAISLCAVIYITRRRLARDTVSYSGAATLVLQPNVFCIIFPEVEQRSTASFAYNDMTEQCISVGSSEYGPDTATLILYFTNGQKIYITSLENGKNTEEDIRKFADELLRRQG